MPREPYRPAPEDYKAIFEDHRVGNAIFEQLLKIFAKPAITDGGIDAVLKTYQRLGQRSVIDHIVNQINIANGVRDEPTPPTGESNG